MLTQEPDGTIVDESGRVVLFSQERFVRDICEGNCCFICGARPEEKTFNDEHVIPNWLLRRHKLHNRTITLPNDQSYCYDRYKVPCCEDCNSLMGGKIETPVRSLIEGGFNAVIEHVKSQGPLLFVVWAALIYFKTHLRDGSFRYHLDNREKVLISDLFDWSALAHIHSLARSFYTGARIEPRAHGSFIGLRADKYGTDEHFDYTDIFVGQSLLIRSDDVAFLASFNDYRSGEVFLSKTINRITGPLSLIQLREVLSHLVLINARLKERPSFKWEVDLDTKEIIAHTECPELPELNDPDMVILGQLVDKALMKLFGDTIADSGFEKDVFIERFILGKITNLFDKEGNFVRASGR